MRFIRSALIVACCSVVGCSSDDTSGTPAFLAQSGTRLKLRYRTTSDGLRHQVGIFDSQRNEDCVLGPDENGNPACIPAKTVTKLDEVYLDAACTTKGTIVGDGCSPGKIYLRESAEITERTCTPYAPTVYYELVPIENPPTTVFYLKDNGVTCNGHQVRKGAIFVTKGDAVPSGSFVTFETSTKPGTDRLDVVVLKGSDGSIHGAVGPDREPLFYDRELKARCVADTKTGACTPLTSDRNTTVYSDADCTARTVAALDCPGLTDEKKYGRVGDRYYQLGESVSGYHFERGACVLGVGDSALEKAYAIGPEVDFTSLAHTFLEDTTYGRLRALDQVRVGGKALVRATPSANDVRVYWDTKLNESCRPVETSDAAGYCVPALYKDTLPLRYTDADCTQEVTGIGASYVDAGQGPPPRYALVTTSNGVVCGPDVQIRKIGSKVHYDQLYQKFADICIAAETNVDSYETAEPADLNAFAKYELNTE